MDGQKLQDSRNPEDTNFSFEQIILSDFMQHSMYVSILLHGRKFLVLKILFCDAKEGLSKLYCLCSEGQVQFTGLNSL